MNNYLLLQPFLATKNLTAFELYRFSVSKRRLCIHGDKKKQGSLWRLQWEYLRSWSIIISDHFKFGQRGGGWGWCSEDDCPVQLCGQAHRWYVLHLLTVCTCAVIYRTAGVVTWCLSQWQGVHYPVPGCPLSSAATVPQQTRSGVCRRKRVSSAVAGRWSLWLDIHRRRMYVSLSRRRLDVHRRSWVSTTTDGCLRPRLGVYKPWLGLYRRSSATGRRTRQKSATARMTVKEEERPLAAASRHLYMSNQFFSPSTMFKNSSSSLQFLFHV